MKKSIFPSLRSRRFLLISKRVLLITIGIVLSIFVLSEGYYMAIARIDMYEELKMLIKMDLVIGPICGLIAFLFFHDFLPRTKIRRLGLVCYFFLALFVSWFFIAIHAGQTAYRSGISRIQVIKYLFN